MKQVIGHNKQWEQMVTGLSAGKLHHGLILAGARGVGKATFARKLAAEIVDPTGQYSALIHGGTHPDIIYIQRPLKDLPKEGEAPDPDAERKRSINVDQIRKLQSSLTKRPGISEKRAIIIDAADECEVSASNALLKSLEEPPVGCHFLLISHASDSLLPTIRSRCQILRFEKMPDTQVEQVLRINAPHMDDADIAALVRAGEGSAGQAMDFEGLDIDQLDTQIGKIIANGDRDNSLRSAMASKLSLKAAQPRYEAFLRRVPVHIAKYARQQDAQNTLRAVDAWHASSELAKRAMALTLDKNAVILQMGSLLAGLNTHKQQSR